MRIIQKRTGTPMWRRSASPELNNRRAALYGNGNVVGGSGKPLCKILQKFYEYQSHPPELTCGGCPGCRQKGKGVFAHHGTDVQIYVPSRRKSTLRKCGKKVYYNENMKLHSLLMELRVTLRSRDHLSRRIRVLFDADRAVFLQLENNLDSAFAFLERTENDSTCIGWTRDRDHP